MSYVFGQSTFPGIGRCIYCPNTEDLSDEHIIPYSLAGEFTFQAASCPACQTEIGKFERDCARGIYGALRVTQEYPTRRPHERPTHLEVEIECNGVTERRKVPVSEYPASPVVAPIFPPAGILIGRTPSEGIPDIQYKFVLPIPPDQEERLKKLRGDGPTNVSLPVPWNLNPFMCLLAKIAHGFAVARHGLQNFRPLLPDYILDRDRRLSHVIGTTAEPIPMAPPSDTPPGFDNPRHAFQVGIKTINGKHYLAVRLQLFRYLDLPVYEIIAGENPSAELLKQVLRPGQGS